MNNPTDNTNDAIGKLKKELLDVKHAFESLKKKYENDASVIRHRQIKEAYHIKDLVIESSLNPIAVSDLHGNLTYVNPAFINMLGYSSGSEIIGKPIAEFWHAGKTTSEILGAIKVSGGWSGELEAQKKDGSVFDILVSASMVKDLSGEPVSMFASFADITISKHANKIQSASETSYRELFNNVNDAIYIQDENGTFLDVNEGAVKMYGYPYEVLVGKNPLFVSAPGKNDMPAIVAMSEKAFAGEPQQFEFWGLRSNGEIFPKEVRVVNGTYFGKKVNIAMAQDITERKQAETALLTSERRFRELIELAVDGILIGSPEGDIIQANTYMQKLTGRTLKNLIGININELFDQNVLKKKPLRYDLLKKDKTVISERDILRSDGNIVPIEMHTKMMPDGTYQSIIRDITERKKSEETLRQSEEKYKSLVESTSDIIWETDADGLYRYVSPQFESILDYKPEETIGNSPYDFISDEFLSEINARLESTEENTLPFYLLVNKYKHRDGHLVHVETSGVPVYDQSGKISGYRGVSRDISKRYLAEKELRKLSAVVQQSPNTIIITDLNGKMEYINPAGCTISGYSFNELIGESPAIFKSGETTPDVYKSLWRALKAGKEWKGIFYNKKKNGEHFCESASILPIKDAEGEVTHYLGIKEDISKRLLSETALKESEQRYRELFEASPDAIILADIDTGMLVDANTAACNMLGRPLDEIRTLHQTMIHPPRHFEHSKKSFRKHVDEVRNTGDILMIESVILRSDGIEIPVEVLSNTMTLNGRKILQGVFRNIAERKQAREELLKAKEYAETNDKLKSAFLQNITHELRTPLNGIIGFSEMITQMDSSEEDRIEFNKMIKKSSARLINTITNYMDISMIVSGITEINKYPVSLKPLLKKITDQTFDTFTSRNLNLEIILKTPENDAQINTDEILLTKIISHLIDNAVKFTKEGSITLAYDFRDGNHLFSVSDTGLGISDETLPVIFEIFRQADISASREYEGSGLGLSIAKGFVKLLGGEIWVESTNNEGSTFCFTLPEKKSTPAEIVNVEVSAQPEHPIVLVAEDDDSNYKYLEIVLKKASFKVFRSYNGFETIEICRNFPEISILLTDMKMPGMDGFESAREIRKIRPDLPIIALSGLISSDDEAAARLAGCNDYIIKPISKSKLLGTIDKLLHPAMY
ncbi:MAG: PAS domain S-box protein [Bacteroidales bacterium]|nr:PAS domain S-box protein [Bacteroidales bacterium]